MYCKRCGAELGDNDKFCPKCGARIESMSSRQTGRDSSASIVPHNHVPSHSKVNASGQVNGQDDVASPAPVGEASERHLGREPKHVVAKAVLTGIAIIVAAFAIVWCAEGFPGTVSDSVPTGNTAGNINNDGLAAEQDGWTYYLDEGSSNGCSIRKISSEGKSASVIWSSSSATSLGDLSIINDEAYFVRSSSSGDSICKVGLDGKNESTVWSGADGNAAASYLSIVGNEAYFVSDDSTNSYHSICKVGTDGSNEKKILSDSASVIGDLNIVGSEVYFVNGDSICKIGTDGTGEKTVYGGPVDDLNIVAGEAYFVSKDSSGYSICKVGTDGTDEKSIWYTTSGNSPIWLDVAGDNIYFTELGKSSLYRIDTDGKNEMTI